MATHGLTWLSARHEGQVRTEMAAAEVVQCFDKGGWTRGLGEMFDRRPVNIWRIAPNEQRFGLEPFYVTGGYAPGFTTANVASAPGGTEIGCISIFHRANWITPAIWVAGAVAFGVFVAVDHRLGPLDALFLASVTAAGVLLWRGYNRIRLARDHDYVLRYIAAVVKGQRVTEAAT